MEDRSSWKGQSFILLMFAGIVFLCSIFFVLGMLVGRSQARKIAATAATDAAAPEKPALPAPPRENRTPLPFNERAESQRPPAVVADVPAAPVAPIEKPAAVESPKPAPPPKPVAPPKSTKPILWQVDAYSTQSAAEALVRDLSKKGFPAFIVPPGAADKLYRVQVGPFTDPAKAEIARTDLEKVVRHKVIKK